MDGGSEDGREEGKEISQVVVYCKNSIGKDNETPLIKKNERNHKMTSKEIHPEEHHRAIKFS